VDLRGDGRPGEVRGPEAAQRSGRARRVSVTGYWEWVLGELAAQKACCTCAPRWTRDGRAVRAQRYNTEFAGRSSSSTSATGADRHRGHRREFLGRNGSRRGRPPCARCASPGRVGAGLDPCAALQVPFDLADAQEREVSFRLGAGATPPRRSTWSSAFAGRPAREALERRLVLLEPDAGRGQRRHARPRRERAGNGWLQYQTLAAAIWGRSGFYQSGGAYGFRDQLQDVMALVHAEPGLTREHLLRCAGRQFREGDVQHWWHPPPGRGVRTHCSDDYLWLPYATCRYVADVGDTGVLDERVPFLEGRPVKPDEEAYYDLPTAPRKTARSTSTACARSSTACGSARTACR
jgi:cyclic beta-1,2-glucan synthetase